MDKVGLARVRVVSAAAVLLAAISLHAREDEGRRSRPLACGDLASLAFEGNTSVSAATMVTSGTLVTPNNLTLTNLPAFCRVQGVAKPSPDTGSTRSVSVSVCSVHHEIRKHRIPWPVMISITGAAHRKARENPAELHADCMEKPL